MTYYIVDSFAEKASCSDVCFSLANFVSLKSILVELFTSTGRDRTKKAGVDDKKEKKTTFISL